MIKDSNLVWPHVWQLYFPLCIQAGRLSTSLKTALGLSDSPLLWGRYVNSTELCPCGGHTTSLPRKPFYPLSFSVSFHQLLSNNTNNKLVFKLKYFNKISFSVFGRGVIFNFLFPWFFKHSALVVFLSIFCTMSHSEQLTGNVQKRLLPSPHFDLLCDWPWASHWT